MSTTQNVTGSVTLLYGTQGSGTSTMLIVNQDTVNTVWVNESSQVQYGGPIGVPVLPGGSVSMESTQGLWAVCAPGKTVSVSLIPNGTNYFLPASLSTIGGIKVFLQVGMPTGTIPKNSIWLQQSGADVIGFWTYNGSIWVQQAFDASGIIAVGTVIANLVAAGTIVAGIVNGTTINGATFVATNSGGEFLGYPAAAAAGNLYISISPVSGTDSKGNTFDDGIEVHGPNNISKAQLAVNQTNNIPYLVQSPPNFAGGTWPQLYSFTANVGVAQAYETWLQAGIPSSRNAPYIRMISESANGTTSSVVYIGNLASGGGSNAWVAFGETDSVFYYPIKGAKPGTFTTDNWNPLASALTGWSNTGGANQPVKYKMEADGSVTIIGDISGTAITTSPAIYATLPSGYYNPTYWSPGQPVNPATGTATAAEPPTITVNNAGQVRLYNCQGLTRMSFVHKVYPGA